MLFNGQVFKVDPQLKKYRTDTHITESQSDALVEESATEKGWMTQYQIADLNKIPSGVANYEAICKALVAGLPQQAHQKALLIVQTNNA